VGRYLAICLATLLGASIFAFGVLHLAPMDPARYFVQFRLAQTRPGLRQEQVRALADWYGLSDPIPVQYGRWLGRAAVGDFGRSLVTGRDIGPELARRLPWTIVLAVPALGVAWLVGLLLAGLAARGGPFGGAADAAITAGLLSPVFLVASLLVYAFAVRLTWIPILPPFELNLLDGALWRSMLLPGLSAALPVAAIAARYMRHALRAGLDAPYIRAARARGTPERSVLWRHAMRAARRPLLARSLAVISVLFGSLLVVEDIFGWPGMGRVFMRAIAARDITVIQASLLILAGLVLAAECVVRVLGSRHGPGESVAVATDSRSPGRAAPLRAAGPGTRLAIAIAAVLVLASLAAPLLTRFPPDLVQLEEIQVPPSLRHWMGTDASGRDQFSRLLFAGRVSLALAVLSALAAVVIGAGLAGLAAWRGATWTQVSAGAERSILAIPALAIAMTVISIAGRSPLLIGGIFALCGIAQVTGGLRAVLGSTMRWPFVEASRTAGAHPAWIAERHLLPHLVRPLAAVAIGLIPGFLILEATLGFFGFSLTPTIPTWGTMLWRGREALHRGDWWLLAFPMLFVAASAGACMRIAAVLSQPAPPTYVVAQRIPLGREWGAAAARAGGRRTAADRSIPRPAGSASAAGSGDGGVSGGTSV